MKKINKTISGARSLFPTLLIQACFLLLAPTFGIAATLSDLITQSRALIGDSPYYSPIPRVTDSKIINYLNEGQHFAAAHSWAFVKRTTFSLIEGTTEYNLPNDYQTVKRVTLSDSALPETTIDGLDVDRAKWVQSAGTPQAYYTRTTTFPVIGFYPVATVASTGVIVLDYISTVQDMKEPSDVPFNGVTEFYPLHDSLAKFVAYRYFLMSNNPQLADVWAKEFSQDIKRLAEILSTKPNLRPGFQPDR